MAVTIRDVAREAGVSVATVSRVVNATGQVTPATERRVRDAVGRLEYVPHGGARSLTTRRTQLIGVVLPEMYGDFFSEIIRGVDRTARPAGYHVLVHGTTALSKTITVPVRGDFVDEANETLKVNLSTASGTTVADNQGIGTITDDDLPIVDPPECPPSLPNCQEQ